MNNEWHHCEGRWTYGTSRDCKLGQHPIKLKRTTPPPYGPIRDNRSKLEPRG
jgi:hypothetical protein